MSNYQNSEIKRFEIFRSDEDEAWVARCGDQYRSLNWSASTPQRALNGLLIMLDDVEADLGK